MRPSRSVISRAAASGRGETACSARDRLRRRRGRAARKPVLDHREHQRGRADLEVGRDLGEVGVADDHVQPAVLLGVGVRLVAGVDDRPLERGLEADLDLEEVGPLADLEAVLAAVLADADPAGAADHLAGDEERRRGGARCRRTGSRGASGSSRARRRTRPCCRCCSCRGGSAAPPGSWPARRGGLEHDQLARLVPPHDVERVGDLGRGVLRVGVVDVEPGAVGQDDVGQARCPRR